MGDRLIRFFQDLEHHPAERMALLVAGLLLLWLLEGAIPLVSMHYRRNKVRHAAVNLTFTLIHLVIHTGFAVVIVLLADWCRTNGFGFIYWLHAGVAGAILLGFVSLDFFGGWLVHLIQHKWKLLWRFHLVHHADTNVDVTTGLRHHPVESILRGVFFLAAIALSGAPVYSVMIYQTCLILATQITHANIRLPQWMDRLVSYLFVSPNMHKVHHHWKQPYTDSNYGAVLAVWDRLLGTFRKLDPSELRYGLDRYYPGERDEDLGLLMKKPFGKLES
ncbi:MAG TPA: sterol desaturase family protein [Chitinophagaceae bacterium]|nr:sterol desaturase family protein [Chitinophagaceae bacterium]